MYIYNNYKSDRGYRANKYVVFQAKIPQEPIKHLSKELTNADEFINSQKITRKSKITIGEFKEIFFDKTLTLKEKREKLNISSSTFKEWRKRLGLKREITKHEAKNTSKEAFEKVYHMDIPEKEKYKLLNLTATSYYKNLEKYGFIPDKTAHGIEIDNITPKEIVTSLEEKLSEAQKHKKLGISPTTYLRKVKTLGLKTNKMDHDEKIENIPKEEFDRVFFDKHLGIRHKLNVLGISEPTFLKIAQEYGYKTSKKKKMEYIKTITQEQFDEIFYDKELNRQEKQKILNISHRTYRNLAAKFGHANEIQDDIKIPIEEFDKVYFDKTLSAKDKIKKLKINRDDYYYLILKFGYKTNKQKRSEYISNITREQFLEVANDKKLSEAEKQKKLKLAEKTFSELSKKYGYISERQVNIKRIKEIKKEDFDKVFFDENLTEKQKWEKLNISFAKYISMANEFGYATDFQKKSKYINSITKEEFDKIYNNPDISQNEKCRRLNISLQTYKKLLKSFGYSGK